MLSIINDISGLRYEPGIAGLVAEYNASIVLMHIKGTPETMQEKPEYGDLISEIFSYLKESMDFAVDKGIAKEKIIIDPGIGFGKTLEDNYSIIKHLSVFKDIGTPVLVGISRKSLIGKLYEDNEDRLPATILLNTVAAMNGADIIRVHDVRPPQAGP